MANITVSLPDDLKARAENVFHVRWSSLIRNIIERELEDFEEAERLAQKSRLTEDDVERISKKMKAGIARRVRELKSAPRR